MRANAVFAFMLLFGIVIVAPAAAQTPAPTGGVRYGAVPAPDPAADPVDSSSVQAGEPGAAPTPGSPTPVVPGTKAILLPDGSAAAPADAPPRVQNAIWAANSLQNKPYRYGGGHASFVDSGYDCSGTISFAFQAAGVLKSPLDSSSFMGWGEGGPGQWLTAYAHSGHAYAVIAGLRLDTSAGYTSSSRRARGSSKAAERGPRWRPSRRPSAGFTARHPAGF